MNKRIDLTQVGGFPFTQEILDFMQVSYREAFKGIASLCGNKTILSGVVVTGGAVSSGWISYNGELIPFIGGATGADVVVEETSADLTFEDTVDRPVLFTKVAYIGAPGTFPFSDLKPLNTLKEMWQPGDMKLISVTMSYMRDNFDATGLGVNERTGWKVCNGNNGTIAMDNKLPIGFNWADYTVVDGATGALKTGKGSNLIGATQLPDFSISIGGQTDGDNNDHSNSTKFAGGDKGAGETSFFFDINVPYSRNKSAGQYAQPYYPDSVILLYIQKI